MLRWCGLACALLFLEYAIANDNATGIPVTSTSEQPGLLRQWWSTITEFVTGGKPEETKVTSTNMTHHNATTVEESTSKSPVVAVTTTDTDILRIMKDIVRSEFKNQSSAGGNVDRDAKCLPPADVAANKVKSQTLLHELHAVFSDILNGTLNASRNATTDRRRLNESIVQENTILRIGKELTNLSKSNFYPEIHLNRSHVKLCNKTTSSINKLARALFMKYFGIEKNQSLDESSKDRLSRYLASVHSENITGNDRLNRYLNFLRRHNWTYNGYARYLYNLSEVRREDRAFGESDYYYDYEYGGDYFSGRSTDNSSYVHNTTKENTDRDSRQLLSANNTGTFSILHLNVSGNETEALGNFHVDPIETFSLERNGSHVPNSNATKINEILPASNTSWLFADRTLSERKSFHIRNESILNSQNQTRAESLDWDVDFNITTKAIFKHPVNKSDSLERDHFHVPDSNATKINKIVSTNKTLSEGKTFSIRNESILNSPNKTRSESLVDWKVDLNITTKAIFKHPVNKSEDFEISVLEINKSKSNESVLEGHSLDALQVRFSASNASENHTNINLNASGSKTNGSSIDDSFLGGHSMNISSFWNANRNVSSSADFHHKRSNITKSNFPLNDSRFNESFLEGHSINISHISANTGFNHTHFNINKSHSELNERLFDESFLEGNSMVIWAENTKTNASGNIHWKNDSIDSEIILDEENGTHMILTLMVGNDDTTNLDNVTKHHNITQEDLNLILKFIKGNLTENNSTIEPYSYNASIGSHYDPQRPKYYPGHEISIHLQGDPVPPPPVAHLNAPNTWFNQPPFIWHQPSGGYRVFLPPPLKDHFRPHFPNQHLPALKLVCPPTSTQMCPFYIVKGMRKCYVPRDCPRAGQLCCRVGCGVECTDGILVPIPTHFY